MVSVVEEVVDRQMAKIFEKTADKQKDVRYNDFRTKSNAALSMRGRIPSGFFWLINIEGVVIYGYTKNLPCRHLRPVIEGGWRCCRCGEGREQQHF